MPSWSEPACPSARQRASATREAKAQTHSPQIGDSLWIEGQPLTGRLSMEGTSGAAYRGSLRGETREAALKRPAARAAGVGGVVTSIETMLVVRVLQTPLTTTPRQEVSEPIGLG
jgi:hypothetical protein